MYTFENTKLRKIRSMRRTNSQICRYVQKCLVQSEIEGLGAPGKLKNPRNSCKCWRMLAILPELTPTHTLQFIFTQTTQLYQGAHQKRAQINAKKVIRESERALQASMDHPAQREGRKTQQKIQKGELREGIVITRATIDSAHSRTSPQRRRRESIQEATRSVTND